MAQLSDNISNDCLEFLIHHIFLPPQLPQKAEDSTGEKNSCLLQLLYHTCDSYTRNLTSDAVAGSIWPAARKMLEHFGMFENINSISAEVFKKAVMEMKDSDVIGIHVSCQNAGLVLRRTGDSVIFTSFEASPTSSAVTETTGKLLISYPGPAVSVPWSKVSDSAFLTKLADFVEKMKRDVLGAATGRGNKAGETLPEERESTHPRFVSEMLTGILRAVGQGVEVTRFTKRVGDEVLWDNAKIPWRRSPLWLVVRVALRMVLGEEKYKHFMVFFTARVLGLAIRKEVSKDQLFIMNAKVARRVHKLRDRMPDFVLDEARILGNRAYNSINEGWRRMQLKARIPWGVLGGSNYIRDANITMFGSREYLMRAKDIECKRTEGEGFIPSEVKRIDIMAVEMPDISQVKDAEERKDIMLADFETWVMNNLDIWLRSNIDRSDVYNDLGERMDDYMRAARKAYQGNPEEISIMILTTMELFFFFFFFF